MKNVILLVLTTLFSCINNNTQEKCYRTSEQAFNAIKNAIYLKDVETLKKATYTPDFKINYDSILSLYQSLSIELIPETPDGAYGIKKGPFSELYHVSFNEGNIRKEVKVLEIANRDSCYKIINIADVKTENLNSKITKTKEEKKKKQYSKITTIADGYDVGRVNLWSSPTSNRRQVAFCINNEKVEVLEYSGEYVKVKKSNGAEGWCMTGFLK
jgi:hypothetical protein